MQLCEYSDACNMKQPVTDGCSPLLFLSPPLRNRSDVAPVAYPRRHSNFCIIMSLNSITFFMRAEPPLTERRVLKENGEKTF